MHQKCGTAHPPICPPRLVLPCSFFAVCCCWAGPPLRIEVVLPAEDSHLKDCPRAEAAILGQYLRH